MLEPSMSGDKKIVITGASGFLGRHLVERLRDDERYRVFALSSRPDGLQERIGGTNVTYLHKDVAADERSAEMMKGAIVVHCAYPRNSVGISIADGLRYIQNVFESAAGHGAAAIINISSQSVYSQLRTEMATEETPICLESPYAVGKYAVELMLESICRGAQTRFTNLRMASLIGPGFDQRIVNRFAAKLIHREPITVVLQDRRMGFLDVEDAVNAILSVLDCPLERWRPVYNVGTGSGYTVEEIYEAVASALKERMTVPAPVRETGSDGSSSAVSYELLRADTGFRPKLSLYDSIERIIAHI